METAMNDFGLQPRFKMKYPLFRGVTDVSGQRIGPYVTGLLERSRRDR
jgi:hypothetical protein